MDKDTKKIKRKIIPLKNEECCRIHIQKRRKLEFKYTHELNLKSICDDLQIISQLKYYRQAGIRSEFDRKFFYGGIDNINDARKEEKTIFNLNKSIDCSEMKEVLILPFQGKMLLERYDIIPCSCTSWNRISDRDTKKSKGNIDFLE